MTSKADEVITLNDLSIKVVRSARRRTLSLELGYSGITARAPSRMSLRSIKQFIRSKQNWIHKHLSNRPIAQQPIVMKTGAPLKFFDSNYSLAITNGRGKVTIDEKAQVVVPIIESHLPREETAQRKLVKWYKLQALQALRELSCERAAIMYVDQPKLITINTNDISVRDYKRRWGSCNQRGELSFNWRIIMAPKAVCEYVVTHELAHRKQFNHSRRFWQIVEQQIPNWQESRDWLSQNGRNLYRF